ncbi:MAG: chemotaxis protein CheB [Chloroflexi bacterium]|nr:MAG: chemotaxis protein CheB [Chloroflexota bacterium]TMF76995.1 MAG: chemotaxis protein CheB [Chloroflexota bacterium]TMG48695.1 MAG: chemotaxis protein CheB [Chloroflexota bacterium]
MTEPRDIIAIGGSAGAIESLGKLVSLLPAQLDAAIFVVIHTYPLGDSLLPAILTRRGSLSAAIATDGEPIVCDRIYVAPPDYHLMVERGRVRLSSGPKEGGHRPAIDPLFRSAASAYRERVIGVILSGTLDDGSSGLRVIRQQGGSAIVQEPKEALFPQMPENAIWSARPQHVAPVAEIARLIASHAGKPGVGGEASIPTVAASGQNGGHVVVGAHDAPGTPTGIACPDCHGVLWAATEDAAPDFRCRVGHAYSDENLLEAHASSLEASLWAGVRALEEQASLSNHLAGKAEKRGDRLSAARFHDRAGRAGEHATRMQALLLARQAEPA